MTSPTPHIGTTGRPRQDAAKRRGEYLWKKVEAYLLSGIGGAIGLVFGALSLIFLIFLLFINWRYLTELSLNELLFHLLITLVSGKTSDL